MTQMALRDILVYPHPLLQRKAKPVDVFDADLERLMDDMVETMRQSNGIGLAGPQVGELLRTIVVEIPTTDETPPTTHKMINPTIVDRSGEVTTEEGCLSCPGFFIEVGRSSQIRIEGQHPDGSPLKLDADGLLAVCIQHEIDHLEGKLLVNYVSSIKRQLYRDQMRKDQADSALPSTHRLS